MLISWLRVYFCVRIMLSLSLWLCGIYWNQTFWYFQHGFFCLGLLLLVRVFCTFIDILAFSPSSMKNVMEFLWILHWVCMFDIIVFFFTTLILSWNSVFFHFFPYYLSVLIVKGFSSRHLVSFFETVVNETFFLNFSACSLLLCRNITDFCVVFYLAVLQIFIIAKHFLVESFKSFKHRTMSAPVGTFGSLPLVCSPFSLLQRKLLPPWTRAEKVGTSVMVHVLEEIVQLPPVWYSVGYTFVLCSLYYVEICPFYF